MTKETINALAGLYITLGANASGDQFLLASRSEESKAARAKFKLQQECADQVGYRPPWNPQLQGKR